MPFQNQVNQELAYGVPGTFASNNPDASAVPPEGAYVAGTGGCTIAAFGWDQGDGTVLNAPPASTTSYTVTALAVGAGGTGYAVGDTAAFAGGKATVSTIGTGGVVTAVTLQSATAQSTDPTATGVATTTNGSGSGLTLNVTGTSSTTAAGAPTGLVFNDRSAWISDIYDEATMVMPQGYMVDLKTAGDYFAVATTAATAGQKVFASTTDGTLSTGAAGATVTGAVETNFYITLGGGVGETITISTWSRG